MATDSYPSLLPHGDSAHEPESQQDEMVERVIGSFGWTHLVQSLLVSLSSMFDAQQTFISVFTDAEPTESNSKTIVSEWGLERSSSFVKGLPASSFFFGCLIGGLFLVSLADSSLGRKKLLFLSCLIMSIAGVLTGFAENVWIYSALRFISGVGSASIGTCTIVLVTEKAPGKWSGRVGTLEFFFTAIGILSLPAIAYMNMTMNYSWRVLYLWMSVPPIFHSLIIYFFVTESPKWLFEQGRVEEAMAAIERSISAVPLIERETRKKMTSYSSMMNLFAEKVTLRRILPLTVLGFGLGLVDYGMALGVGNLGFDIYLGVTFNALLEMASYFATLFVIERWNRKYSLLLFSTVSGLCSLMICMVEKKRRGFQVVLELAAFFNACTAYNVVVMYVLELFPTRVKNSATAMVNQALVFGAAFGPVLASAGRKNNVVSYGIFGGVGLCCGLFVMIFLPETKGVELLGDGSIAEEDGRC